ncbi:alpha/beta fold hydrolase [Brevibacillus laterosporus]|uniref:alpha/beta fold hydrolase n=1 Tax=Brevibacillus laterosporus TaxID=1465 RepID=UPI0026556C70|nr:alpha/beta hydrolase [Brevibacillus laterosporus]MDN9012902.1 alpha/beta hydrolase [Brevibacillus laterosporus]MDO0944009.1 alpha/beta hydrolase [Brevibacillus laterosporus]
MSNRKKCGLKQKTKNMVKDIEQKTIEFDRSESRGYYNENFHTCSNRRLYSKYSQKSTPCVIFIAGLGDSCETWNEVQDRISQETSTFSYDRAGVGRSQGVSGPRTCHDLVEELCELLLALDVEPPYILVGHSFGGLIARLYASIYPQLISGIVLVDSAPEYKELKYEKVLPEKLVAENREYFDNPLLNSEKIDKVQSYKQIVENCRQSNIPLSIITRGLPDMDDGEWPCQEILELEQRLQVDFQRLSTSSKHRIASCSGHYIHHDEPEIVIEEIMVMLKEIRK